MIKIRNLILGIKDQLPISRLIRNIKTGNVFGLFSVRSHLNFDGKPKVMYKSKETAIKSAKKMQEKHGYYYSNYKCIFCDGYHLGRNRESEYGKN